MDTIQYWLPYPADKNALLINTLDTDQSIIDKIEFVFGERPKGHPFILICYECRMKEVSWIKGDGPAIPFTYNIVQELHDGENDHWSLKIFREPLKTKDDYISIPVNNGALSHKQIAKLFLNELIK